MELIYRNTIMMKRIKETMKNVKVLSLLLAILCLCTLSGCGLEKGMNSAAGSGTAKGFGEQESAGTEEQAAGSTAKQDTAGAAGDEPELETEDIADEKKTTTMSDLLGSSGKNEAADDEGQLSDTVLWFNATYAPLTYSNSGNWKLVGGLEPTETNQELVQYLMRRDWDIEDKNSALETIESLKKKGHRARCRECMEELAEMGMLDYSEEEFLQELAESGIEENLFRYVIAYYLYQDGLDADYIAAWDLCRVNQLYADFYICGYMTYEQAMDASLENSKILQQMYPSWEAMVDAYMLGYQFWQSDPCLTEDSPTLKRYGYYEILREMDNGPYTLDWNMELDKSW